MSGRPSAAAIKVREIRKRHRRYLESLARPIGHEEDIRSALERGLYSGRPKLAEAAIRWLLRTNAQLRKEIRRLESAAAEWSLKSL
ncbi:MAG: hypothetical protein HY646_17075 [Acidobacteria bacterium]|nr:hypothetical protein [Acidobacteriota bacterium]